MSSFGPTFVVESRDGHVHDHTAILLHGRGSTGEEFAEELFATTLSDGQKPSLADRLPSWRWVFPSSPSTWNATFEEWMPAWFEAHSLADPTARQDLQQSGLRASAQHVETIVEDEIRRLQTIEAGGSDAHSRVVLGGISLGGAVALWTLLSTKQPERPLGGFAVVSTWLPFASEITKYLGDEATAEVKISQTDDGKPVEPLVFVQIAMAPLRKHIKERPAALALDQNTSTILTAPVFLGHGRDDAYVDMELGRQAHKLLVNVGFTSVEWHDYEGAEQEGHWLKEPEEMDDLARFLEAVHNRIRDGVL
ncbi:hypothetical protein SPBR_01933 [Sporothrix brasiliensis 5110]|uniref:Phospholipase/carboxylesterase/thioesterase domain-containing protein n=1 Tax=Sporothrix brasiliensis 5110 TaxID=1398154 RepID=A0A0C2EZA6_9PEZI|nr:uncharacterized protein SPBR_01933 [Sporothrix brasiliensis 5110]KIH91839.1 hypothetical protein SPBR_01933 [Sporothrix brasiliensis 5110]